MRPLVFAIIIAAAIVAAGCQRKLTSTESKLIGDWSVPNSANLTDDGFAGANTGVEVTTFKIDHTFLQTNHPNGKPPFQELSGIWHLAGDQLTLKYTWDRTGELAGQELQFVISDLQPKSFVAANAPNPRQKILWTRVK